MPAKDYGKRINDRLDEVQRDVILHEPLFGNDASNEDLGEAFRIIAWGVINQRGMEPVRRAFEETQIDPRNPYAWADLLFAFADAHYSVGDAGRPPLRTRKYNEELARDIGMVAIKRNVVRRIALSRAFLEDPISQRYPTLKTEGGVKNAINALVKAGFLDLKGSDRG